MHVVDEHLVSVVVPMEESGPEGMSGVDDDEGEILRVDADPCITHRVRAEEREEVCQSPMHKGRRPLVGEDEPKEPLDRADEAKCVVECGPSRGR